jgi:hypothetical protein
MSTNVYQPVWDKFLPLILMKIKSAIRKQQAETLVMDQVDFEKASHRKKSSYVFKVELNEGRIQKSDSSSIGIDFARALKDNETAFALIRYGSIMFSLNNKFVLTITPKIKVADPPVEGAEPVVNE